MVSFMQRLMLSLRLGGFETPQFHIPSFKLSMPVTHINRPPFGVSKRTVAQDRRASAKARARKRAKRLGQA